jgi:Na+/H+-dicarboxylate symporter
MGGHKGLVAAAAGIVLFGALFAAGRPALAYAVLIASFTLFCLTTSLSLNWQILLGAALGAVFGLVPGSLVESTQIVGKLFIAMLKMLIAPMILFSIAFGIAGMGDVRQLGRIGARTVALYVGTMAAAVLTGLVLVNVFQPGAGSTLRETAFFAGAIESPAMPAASEEGLSGFLMTTVFQVLANPFASLAEGAILPIVLFAILFGVALLEIGAPGQPVIHILRGAYAAIMTIIRWFIRLAPVGIFALIGSLVASVGLEILVANLLAFSLVVIGGILLHAAITLPLVARVFGGLGPLELFRGIREALLVAFSTSSSAATLPVTTRCVEENLNVPPAVSSFVLPLGATVNMDGTALYEAIAALFVAHVYGIELSIASQIVVFFIAMVTAIGAPGIPSAGMVTMVVVLESVGLPVEAVGILITIDRFLDTFRTMCNVEGDAVVSVCVARAAGTPGA